MESLNGDMRSNGEAEAASDGAASGTAAAAATLPPQPPPAQLPAPPSSSSRAVRDHSQESKTETRQRLPESAKETEDSKPGKSGAVTKKPPLPPAGQFTKSAQKRRKAKAKKQQQKERLREEEEERLRDSSSNSAGFTYSVKYFNWAVSSSESEEDEDDDGEDGSCPTVVLPVSMARMRLNGRNESRKN